MASQGPPPTNDSLTPSLGQPLAPPPRTSSRGSSITREGNGLQGSGQHAASTAPISGQALALPGHNPGQQTATSGLSGDTAQETSESVEESSKRSLTGRRRDASRGSKRSADARTSTNEKRPGSAGAVQTNAPPQKSKKKGGLLAFLNCCAAPDPDQETASPDSAQPAKSPVQRGQPTRAKSPPQSQQPQTASVTDTTSADDSREIIDEKASHSAYQNAPTTDLEKTAYNDQTSTNHSEYHTQPDTRTRPLENRLGFQPADPSTGPTQLDTSAAGQHSEPQLNVQAATPVMTTADEDQVISDRTPEQQQRDTDIEMTDAGPSIPLSSAEVPQIPENQTGGRARKESDASSHRVDLPPPPPLAERQAQTSAPAFEAQDPGRQWLLPPLAPEMRGKKCLVLDLDETLVHSSFKILHQADFTIPVEIEGQYHNVYVIKRPGVDTFLKRVGEIYEVVVFTASVSKYGDPVLDNLDISGSVHHRLFRESCYNHQGNYVKDLSQVGRRLEETIIIDNSPTSYIFHPQHAVPISSWFSDAHDNELLDLIPVLEDLAGSEVRDVSLVLDVAL